MRRRDIRAARKEARQYDWQALLTANDGGDEFDYESPAAEPDATAKNTPEKNEGESE